MGLLSSTVVALWPDMLPAAASNTFSGTPDASSMTSKTCSLCTPASASGVSARDVRAEMNASDAAAVSSTRSDFTVTMSFRFCGSSLIHRFISANSASKSWPDVGAVTTTLFGKRRNRNHSIAQLADVDLPVPCPERTLILRSPDAMAERNSA